MPFLVLCVARQALTRLRLNPRHTHGDVVRKHEVELCYHESEEGPLLLLLLLLLSLLLLPRLFPLYLLSCLSRRSNVDPVLGAEGHRRRCAGGRGENEGGLGPRTARAHTAAACRKTCMSLELCTVDASLCFTVLRGTSAPLND